MRTKDYSFKEFDKILKKNGYEYKSCKGDHYKYEHKETGKCVVLCKRHPNKMVCRRMIKEHGLIV